MISLNIQHFFYNSNSHKLQVKVTENLMVNSCNSNFVLVFSKNYLRSRGKSFLSAVYNEGFRVIA
jgi:hypothetical protein